MAAKRSRNHKPKKRQSRSANWQDTIINASIAILSLIIFGFIFSFSRQYPQTGISMSTTLPETGSVATTAAELYEQRPILDIKIEVLNGCGVSGVAAELSEYLRDHNLDVVRSENADHFEYNETIIVQKNENLDALQRVTDALGFDINDRRRIAVKPDPAADVALTVIIGKDFHTLPALKSLFTTQND